MLQWFLSHKPQLKCMMADVNRTHWIVWGTAQTITSFIHAFENYLLLAKCCIGANVKTKFKIILLYIRAWLINSVVFVSVVQQSDSVTHTHMCILFQILFPFRLLQKIEQTSLCYIDFQQTSLSAIYFKYSSVYLSILNFQSIIFPHTSPLVTVSLFCKFVSLFRFYK